MIPFTCYSFFKLNNFFFQKKKKNEEKFIFICYFQKYKLAAELRGQAILSYYGSQMIDWISTCNLNIMKVL